MSNRTRTTEKQRRSGLTLIIGAVVILAGGFTAFFYYDVPPIGYLGLVVPVVILSFFGYRYISAGRAQTAVGDERTAELHGKVSINAFWWLVATILFDTTFGVFPDDGAGLLYIAFGLLVYVLYYGYYRYR